MRVLPIWVLGLLGFSPLAATASEAAFSPDGKTLWVLSHWANFLLCFKSGETEPTRIPIRKEILANSYDPTQIIADADGLVIDGGGKLWRWNPADHKTAPQTIADLPPSFIPNGMTWAEGEGMAGMILVSKTGNGDKSLFSLKQGETTFKPVSVRDVHHLSACPVFAGGRVLFGGDGDLYEGGIKFEAGAKEGGGTLWGCRNAPLAIASGGPWKGGIMGVHEVVIAGGGAWATPGGVLVSVPLPNKPAVENDFDLAASLQRQQEQLAQTKILHLPANGADQPADSDIGGIGHLCAWNGKDGAWKIAFCSGSKVFWLLEKGMTEPKKIGVELNIHGK